MPKGRTPNDAGRKSASRKLNLTAYRNFGDFATGASTTVLAKHSKSFSHIDCISVGVDRMQRNFEPMQRQVEHWRTQQLSAAAAKLTIYRAFIEGDLEVPRHLARRVSTKLHGSGVVAHPQTVPLSVFTH
ncbi:MAG: hypothetical protein LAO30_21615 [Acidobacteriia bacterium]|nr:hypothetical protein [Terriglobia bacterium]